jgi:hypothetical protein
MTVKIRLVSDFYKKFMSQKFGTLYFLCQCNVKHRPLVFRITVEHTKTTHCANSWILKWETELAQTVDMFYRNTSMKTNVPSGSKSFLSAASINVIVTD